MKSYVLGFCFSSDHSKVVLIEKNRPDWQAGRLNGIGGHVEEGETPFEAMRREFREEANYPDELDWECYGRLFGDDFEVWLFHAHHNAIPVYNSGEEGVVDRHHVACVLGQPTSKGKQVVPNARYLIPMAINHVTRADRSEFLEIREGIGPVRDEDKDDEDGRFLSMLDEYAIELRNAFHGRALGDCEPDELAKWREVAEYAKSLFGA